MISTTYDTGCLETGAGMAKLLVFSLVWETFSDSNFLCRGGDRDMVCLEKYLRGFGGGIFFGRGFTFIDLLRFHSERTLGVYIYVYYSILYLSSKVHFSIFYQQTFSCTATLHLGPAPDT